MVEDVDSFSFGFCCLCYQLNFIDPEKKRWSRVGQQTPVLILNTTVFFHRELTLFWSKLQRRIDPSLETFLERCRQFGVIAKTQQHLFCLIRVIQTEVSSFFLPCWSWQFLREFLFEKENLKLWSWPCLTDLQTDLYGATGLVWLVETRSQVVQDAIKCLVLCLLIKCWFLYVCNHDWFLGFEINLELYCLSHCCLYC